MDLTPHLEDLEKRLDERREEESLLQWASFGSGILPSLFRAEIYSMSRVSDTLQTNRPLAAKQLEAAAHNRPEDVAGSDNSGHIDSRNSGVFKGEPEWSRDRNPVLGARAGRAGSGWLRVRAGPLI